jgi:hypothetical protein
VACVRDRLWGGSGVRERERERVWRGRKNKCGKRQSEMKIRKSGECQMAGVQEIGEHVTGDRQTSY